MYGAVARLRAVSGYVLVMGFGDPTINDPDTEHCDPDVDTDPR